MRPTSDFSSLERCRLLLRKGKREKSRGFGAALSLFARKNTLSIPLSNRYCAVVPGCKRAEWLHCMACCGCWLLCDFLHFPVVMQTCSLLPPPVNPPFSLSLSPGLSVAALRFSSHFASNGCWWRWEFMRLPPLPPFSLDRPGASRTRSPSFQVCRSMVRGLPALPACPFCCTAVEFGTYNFLFVVYQ